MNKNLIIGIGVVAFLIIAIACFIVYDNNKHQYEATLPTPTPNRYNPTIHVTTPGGWAS